MLSTLCSTKFARSLLLCLGLVAWENSYSVVKTCPLTLCEAEQIALAIEPEVMSFCAKSNSLGQQAIADAQLPDPKLKLGLINVPTDSFSLNRDDMTMIELGLKQTFPPGHSLKETSCQTMALSHAECLRAKERKLVLLRDVRNAWFDVYYWNQALNVLTVNHDTFNAIYKATLSRYSVGKGSQQDVLQAKVELSLLDTKISQTTQSLVLAKSQLERWIGECEAQRPISDTLPHWGCPPPFCFLQEKLVCHPLLKVDEALIQARCHAVNFAKEQYKPGFDVDLNYGFRQGRSCCDNMKRSDMVTAEVTIDLPIFPKNRQDKRLCARVNELEAAKFDRDAHYRDLMTQLKSQYGILEQLCERQRIYKNHLVLETRQNAKAALLAYQSNTVDFTTVMRAYITELNTGLELLQLRVDQAKTHAALLYLEGK